MERARAAVGDRVGARGQAVQRRGVRAPGRVDRERALATFLAHEHAVVVPPRALSEVGEQPGGWVRLIRFSADRRAVETLGKEPTAHDHRRVEELDRDDADIAVGPLALRGVEPQRHVEPWRARILQGEAALDTPRQDLAVVWARRNVDGEGHLDHAARHADVFGAVRENADTALRLWIARVVVEKARHAGRWVGRRAQSLC
jgi:hypothetical protein